MPATNFGSYRAQTHAISVARETEFNGDFEEGGTPAVGYLVMGNNGFDPSVLVSATLESEQVQYDLEAVPPNGEGVMNEAQPSIPDYLEGLGVGNEAGDGVAAVENGFTLMLEAWCGQAVNLLTGDTVASAASALLVTATTPANFDVGDFIGFVSPTTGKLYIRKVIAKDGGTDEMTLHAPLPFTPAPAAVIYGTAYCVWQETPECTVAIKALAIDPDGNQNHLMGGCIPSFSMPETPGSQAPTCEWGIRLAAFNKNPFIEAQTLPDVVRPVPMAGGEFLIKRRSSTTWTRLQYGRMSFDPGQELDPDENVNSDFNTAAWTRMATAMALTLLFKNNAAVPADSAPVTSWREFFYNGNEELNAFDIWLCFSRPGLGQTFFKLLENWRINQPVVTDTDVDGKSLQRAVFQPRGTDDSTPPAVTLACGQA